MLNNWNAEEAVSVHLCIVLLLCVTGLVSSFSDAVIFLCFNFTQVLYWYLALLLNFVAFCNFMHVHLRVYRILYLG